MASPAKLRFEIPIEFVLTHLLFTACKVFIRSKIVLLLLEWPVIEGRYFGDKIAMTLRLGRKLILCPWLCACACRRVRMLTCVCVSVCTKILWAYMRECFCLCLYFCSYFIGFVSFIYLLFLFVLFCMYLGICMYIFWNSYVSVDSNAHCNIKKLSWRFWATVLVI